MGEEIKDSTEFIIDSLSENITSTSELDVL